MLSVWHFLCIYASFLQKDIAPGCYCGKVAQGHNICRADVNTPDKVCIPYIDVCAYQCSKRLSTKYTNLEWPGCMKHFGIRWLYSRLDIACGSVSKILSLGLFLSIFVTSIEYGTGIRASRSGHTTVLQCCTFQSHLIYIQCSVTLNDAISATGTLADAC